MVNKEAFCPMAEQKNNKVGNLSRDRGGKKKAKLKRHHVAAKETRDKNRNGLT